MKRLGCHSNQRLLHMLGEALRKELEGWKPRTYSKTPAAKQGLEVGPEHRDAAVTTMAALNAKYDFYPETFFLGTAILDQFLAIVKARPKHMKCIGVAAYYLAVKTIEEDEVIPGILELVRESECGCSQAEIARMERCILVKLNWDLRATTPLDFLHIFHALLFCNVPHLLDACGHMTPARQLSLVTAKLERCMQSHTALAHAPSTLALAVLSLELELFCPNWLSITYTLQKMVQIDNEEMIHCREVVSQSLAGMGRGSGGKYVYASKSPSPPASTTPKKRRKVLDESEDQEAMCPPPAAPPPPPPAEEEDNIYEGIKQLYEEDAATTDLLVAMASCGSEARQEAFTTTALQAVAN